jgi:hypothetical protein
MELSECIGRLSAAATTLRHMLVGVDAEQAAWKPRPDAWSLLEVVNHLADEERDDFRRRLALTLEDPTRDWPPIDTEGWVTSRDYASRDWHGSLEDFASERQRSVDWLAGLGSVDWSICHEHPKLGPMRAGDLMASWIVHDLLHTRQALRLQYDWAVQLGAPYHVAYAGGW